MSGVQKRSALWPLLGCRIDSPGSDKAVTRKATISAMRDTATNTDLVISHTQTWLTRAVIGLQLCPFAKAVHLKDQIRYAVSPAESAQALLQDLVHEIEFLQRSDPAEVETTLLIHPGVLQDFLDFNDFLDVADAALVEIGLEGVLQIASFHPHYQFAGAQADAIENFSNRSPYPTLHLLRESSIEQAMASFDGFEDIVERNINTLQALGHEGWQKLWV
jgi:hypothetical protein